jgi:uncharacterized repeat protein (TIGR01451 family)
MRFFQKQMKFAQQQTHKRLKKHLFWRDSIFRSHFCLISGLSLFAGIFCLSAQPTYAEGSISLTPPGSTGLRPFLLFNTSTSSGITNKTVIKVYANAGETIDLGSSANGVGTGVINYRTPSGSAGSCSNLLGKITNRAQEVAGPLPNLGGYTPCIITAAQTTTAGSGIWEIDFVSPNIANTTYPGSISATGNWSAQANNEGSVTAWDVTVRDSNGVAQLGRAYTNYLAATMSINQDNAFKSLIYILTKDGYQYSINTNGLDPFTFLFFSNNKGFKTTATGNPTYRSYDFTGANPGTFPAGISVQNPGATDTATDFTNKIFFNPISTALPSSASVSSGGSTWLSTFPSPPPTPTGFTFTGTQNTPGQAGAAQGGNFQFSSSSPGPFQIILDLNQNGILGDGNDRVIAGTATGGTTTAFWDGIDGLGVVVPPSAIAYNASVTLFAGEVHFPLLDAESNKGGLIIQRLNNPSPATTPIPNPFWVYYNDTGMLGNGGVGGGAAVPPSPLNALLGQDSSAGAHKYGNSSANGFGNITGIDTWSYYPSQTIQLAAGITIKAADLRITKNHSPSSVVAGGLVTYTIDVTNFNNPPSSVSDVVGAAVKDILPSQLSGATLVSCSVITGTGSCVSSSFTGNTFDATVNLNSGATIRFVIQATLAAGSTGSVSNSATIYRTADVADPVDQDTSGGTNLSETATDVALIVPGADLVTSKTGPTTAVAGSTVTYNLSTVNNGPSAASNVVVTDNIGTGLTGVVPSNSGTYNTTTGIVTFPTIASLANGATQTYTVSVTAPASGSITDIVASTSSTGDPNLANNNGSTPAAQVVTTITALSSSPNLLLVKRITAVTGSSGAIQGGDNVALYKDENGIPAGAFNNPYDDNDITITAPTSTTPADTDKWPDPATFLIGAVNGGNVGPKDVVEYTIYFLSAGSTPAKEVTFCDRIPANQTFVPDGYNGLPQAPGGNLTNRGIAVSHASSYQGYTNLSDGDTAQYYTPGSVLPGACGAAANTTGAVVVNLGAGATNALGGTVPNATTPGSPNTSYGFVRFKAKVN